MKLCNILPLLGIYPYLGLTQPFPNCLLFFTKIIINALISVILKLEGITHFGTWMLLGMEQLYSHCSIPFTQIIVHTLNLVKN